LAYARTLIPDRIIASTCIAQNAWTRVAGQLERPPQAALLTLQFGLYLKGFGVDETLSQRAKVP